MKLNNGDRIKGDDSIYTVAAVLWSTVYLCAVNDGRTNFDYEMSEVQKEYKNVEFLRKGGLK